MVDYNLIHSLGSVDSDVDAAVARALGGAADDISQLVKEDQVQNITPGAIVKGRISAKQGDDFIVELGGKSEGILEKTSLMNRKMFSSVMKSRFRSKRLRATAAS